MADIRINSLPTTASASSSDDFLALDGATNGTRKLNAYSPTFGGNLTVSGTGNSSVAGNLGIGLPERELVTLITRLQRFVQPLRVGLSLCNFPIRRINLTFQARAVRLTLASEELRSECLCLLAATSPSAGRGRAALRAISR